MCESAGEADDVIPPAFAALASKFAPLVHAILVDGVEPSTVAVSDLLNDLRWNPSLHVWEGARVLRAPAVLSAAACATLRDAVDEVRSVKEDSTDGAAEHEVLPPSFL